MMAEQPNFLTSRLRKLQAETRKEYEESGREKLNAPKIVAAAAVYAEDQAANHSSGYQSNDSAPEESNEEPTADQQGDFVYAQVGDNLQTMTLDDANRPWHEEVEEYLVAENASHSMRTPTLSNGHDDSVVSSHWTQQNARNTPLENRNDVSQPSGAGQLSWPRHQSQELENQIPADEWSCQTQQTPSSQSYRLFDESSAHAGHNLTQNVDHRQWQASAPPAALAPQYTFQDRRQYDEEAVEAHQWEASSADDRNREQQWAPPAQRIVRGQYEQQQSAQSIVPADLQLHQQHQYSDACGQVDWKQHSDELRQPSQVYYESAPKTPVYVESDDTSHWMKTTTNLDDLATNLNNRGQQFISPRVMSVAAALSSINSASRNDVANEYLAQTSPMIAASYDNTALQFTPSSAGYQNHLLRIAEPSGPPEESRSYRVGNCANTEICSTLENQVVCVESPESDEKQYYLIVDQPPSLAEVDVSKPPPRLPPIWATSGLANSVSNSSNSTKVSYMHHTDDRHMQPTSSMLVRPQALYHESSPLQQSSPRSTDDVQRYSSQQIAQSSHHVSDSVYPQLTLEMLNADATQSNVHRNSAQSTSYSSEALYPQLTPEMIHLDTSQSDAHQRVAHSSSYLSPSFHPESTHEILHANSPQSDGHPRVAQVPSYSHGSPYAPKSPQMYAEAPQSDFSYWETPLPGSPPHGATPDMLGSEVAPQQQMTAGSKYIQSTPFSCETSVDEFPMQRCVSPMFETPCLEYTRQTPFNPKFETGDKKQSPFHSSFERTIVDFGRQMPNTELALHPSPSNTNAQVNCSQSASTVQVRRSICPARSTEVEVGSVATSTPTAPETAQMTPTNPATSERRDGQRWANSKNGNQSLQNTTNLANGLYRDTKRGSNARSSFESDQSTPPNQTNGPRRDSPRGSNYRNSNDSGYSTPQDRRQHQRHSGSGGRFSGGSGGPGSGNRSMKRISYTPEEEHRLSISLIDSYGAPLDEVLKRCFDKKSPFGKSCTLRSNRFGHQGEDMFVSPLWPNEACPKLAQLKDRLNGVKERLSSYDLNDWHRHTRNTNPADMVMRRLRSDIKVEFLTQAWCKFYELVDSFNLVPQDARKSGELRTIHLCEAPGAFVASLNHYLRLNHPNLKWRWRANSLNPFYEGNHLSAMINDDRFMLQTIENWDFGPDMTGDILHPGYPDHLRKVWGDGKLTHLVTSDGSFDCQDKPEEQEKLVSWLHLKEALTAIRVLRKGGHFVIKMFTFFECQSVCLLFLLDCVFESINVMKPATSKEGNSEVYVVCREFKDEPSFEPFIRRLIAIDEETYSKFAMFPLERIPRQFMRSLEECAAKFADFQINVIERNIRLYQHERYNEFRRHFEFVQEKLFEEYVELYRVQPIPLDQTVVRMPYRRSENLFINSPKVLEQRERKQGSHDDQLKRSSLGSKDLVKVVADELAAFPHRQMLSEESTVPKVELLPRDFEIRCGKPIHTITSSQFCHGMLIRVRNELMNTMDRKKYYIAAAEMERSADIEKNPEQYPNLCDFAKPLMLMKTYNDTQREIYGMLFDRLTTLEKNENLTLFCFPLLTQFNISVLCILNQIFEEIVLEPPHVLYLRKRDTKNFGVWMPKLQEISRTYTPEQAVISFLPVRKITGSTNPFYSWVIEANNSQIIRELKLFSSYHS